MGTAMNVGCDCECEFGNKSCVKEEGERERESGKLVGEYKKEEGRRIFLFAP